MGFIEKAREQKGRISEKSDALRDSGNIDETSEGNTQNTTLLHVRTEYDVILDTIRSAGGNIAFSVLAKNTGIKKGKIENILKVLEKQKIVQMTYPLNIFSDIIIKTIHKKEIIRQIELPPERELVDSYSITVDHVTGNVNIWMTQKEDVPIYEVIIPQLDTGTQAFVDYMITEMAKTISIEESEITDAKKNDELRLKFFNETKKNIKKKMSSLPEQQLNMISGIVMHEMYGLGDMEIMMGDNWLEEIAINGSNVPVSVYHKRFGWTKTTKYLKNEEEIYNFASQVGRKVGRQINTLNPLMDAHLATGDRVAATLAPISSSGNTITIRRFSRNPWTIIHLIDPKINTMSIQIAAFLWLCMHYELNILVAGGTASGKTSVLNSICSLIPTTQRILSIEDTRELALPNALHWNWIPLASRKPNPEGQGGVSMLDLMVESLRMRPDRIIVGEVRRREQAETLFETMHTGHSVYATIHADTVEQVQRRLIEPPIEIPKTEIGALQLIVVQYRDRRKGARRTLEIAEILNQETDSKSLDLNYLFRWKARTDTFEKINDSVRVMEDLNLHTGMTANDIQKELKEKEIVLSWMVKHDVKDVDIVGKIMKLYYKSSQIVVNAAVKDMDPNELVA